MQDRFKFRCFYSDDKKMYYHDFELSKIAKEDEKFATIMQCTGLKDRNGKLIYEGDIVEILHSGGKKAVVYWNEKNVCFELRGEAVAYNAHITIRNDYFEIIGNIYQNPELLEDK